MPKVRDSATPERIRDAGRVVGIRAMATAALTSAPVITDLFGILTSVLAAIVFMLAAVPLCLGITGLVRRRRRHRAAGPATAATAPCAAGIDEGGAS